MFNFGPLILALLAHGPAVLGEVEAAIGEIAGMPHGQTKLQNVAASLGHLATHTSAALGSDTGPAPADRPGEPATENVGDASNSGV